MSISSSVSGKSDRGEKGEKSRLISILGSPVLPDPKETAAAGMTGRSRGISSISSILTASSRVCLGDGILSTVNSSEGCCGVAGMMFSIGTMVPGNVAILSLLPNSEL